METQNKINYFLPGSRYFCVKYTNKEHAEHLMSVLRQNYKVIGLHMRWKYQGRKVHVAMPEYVQNVLNEF